MAPQSKQVVNVTAATVRFAGDSGDGMQLTGMQFTDTAAVFGNDIATLPDYPAEIRAPAGTVAGVSGFQVNFASTEVFTPGDEVDALIAMNPAALKANIRDVKHGGILIVNEDEFDKVSLKKAGYPEGYNPILDEAVGQKYRLYKIPITRLNTEALKESGLGAKEVDRCKNMYALGLIYYLFDRSMDTTIHYLDTYFGKKKNLPQVAAANVAALRAGFNFGDTAEIFAQRYHVGKAPIAPGTYRRITGNEAMAIGLVTASKLATKNLIYCTYPITPASDILHNLAVMKNYGVKTFQAEDEIAAMCAAIGAAYAGQLGVTGTAGPGIALKSEAINLAIMMELPVVIVNVQRGGPSTGLPTKVEQADLLQVLYGRNGDSPAVVLAPRSPADCFEVAIEAVKIAFELMCPVFILSDGYIANGAEPWHIPDPDTLTAIPVQHATKLPEGQAKFQPYTRDEKLARPWAAPGTPGLQHRLGGLEKEHLTGGVCYDGENHQLMTDLRREKVERLADRLPPVQIDGAPSGDLLLIGWGGTYGAITSAVAELRKQGHSVSAVHLRHLSPLPRNLGQVLKGFKHVIAPELNMGQLRGVLRSKYLVDVRGLNKVQGHPFLVNEVVEGAKLMLTGQWGDAEFLEAHHHTVKLEDQSLDQRIKPKAAPAAKPQPANA